MKTTAERETKPKPPPPPPSTWQVVAGVVLRVTATYARISTAGVLLFTDDDGGLIKAFGSGEWRSVEKLDDPFGNSVYDGGDLPPLVRKARDID